MRRIGEQLAIINLNCKRGHEHHRQDGNIAHDIQTFGSWNAKLLGSTSFFVVLLDTGGSARRRRPFFVRSPTKFSDAFAECTAEVAHLAGANWAAYASRR